MLDYLNPEKVHVNGKLPPEQPYRRPIEKFSLAELAAAYPQLHPPVIEGLLREGEVANVISHSKVGKSWLAYSMAVSVITGRDWLDRFPTASGKVLLIDNELHKPTIAQRLLIVGNALGVPREQFDIDLEIWPLRGRLRSLADVGLELGGVEPGEFKLVVLDAKYRFAIAGASENDNSSETLLYNLLDEIAEHTRSAIAVIHHSSKGEQGSKRVTDVGSGAGAMARAADCHLILREHEAEGVHVLDSAVRSFAPNEPTALRWSFPLWLPADDVDPALLKGRPGGDSERQAARDREGTSAILKSLLAEPLSLNEICRRANMGKGRAGRLVAKLETDGHVTPETATVANNKTIVYRLVEGGGL